VGFNFGWDKPVPWFRFRFEEEEDLKALSEVFRNLAAMGFPVDMEHVAERFGIPMAGAQGEGSSS
jgi:phage gp29-like protein